MYPAIIVVIIGAAVSAPILRAVAQMVYNKTGHNGLKGFQKFLMYTIGVLALAMIGGVSEGSLPVIAAIGGLALAVAIMTLVNLKAGILYALILGVTETICGGLVTLIAVVMFVLRIFTKSNESNMKLSLTINEQQEAFYEQQRKNAEADVENRREKAENYAHRLGFSDADQAESMGFKTGQPRD